MRTPSLPLVQNRGQFIRAIAQADYPHELPAFDLALHKGMRRFEQYGLACDKVDPEPRQITLARSKHGGIRYIPLNNTALNALLRLRARPTVTCRVRVSAESGHGPPAGHALKPPREWFDASAINVMRSKKKDTGRKEEAPRP